MITMSSGKFLKEVRSPIAKQSYVTNTYFQRVLSRNTK